MGARANSVTATSAEKAWNLGRMVLVCTLAPHDARPREDRQAPLTHDLLAFMIGVRRTGVTVAMRDFEDAGMVRCSRGDVQIIDRGKLEDASCECYRTVRANFDRLLPRLQAAGMLPNA